MTAIVCIDAQGGMLFNQRRVSSDREVVADIMNIFGDSVIYMRSSSAKLFEEHENVRICDNCLEEAGTDGVCFLEADVADAVLKKADRIVLYHWNRSYPSDVKFPLAKLHSMGKLLSSEDFKGYSHERITREVYAL